jgi:hypothetical protein
MNISNADLTSTETEYLLDELKRIAGLRDQMGGALYFNVLQEDAVAIANRLLKLGVSRETIKEYF